MSPVRVAAATSDVGQGDLAHVPGAHRLTRCVESGGGRAQHDLGLVLLSQGREEAQRPGDATEADEKDAGGIGIEGAGVPDAALTEEAATTGDDIVRGPPRFLVHHHQPDGSIFPIATSITHRRRPTDLRYPPTPAGGGGWPRPGSRERQPDRGRIREAVSA